jgi:hypothetical protein
MRNPQKARECKKLANMKMPENINIVIKSTENADLIDLLLKTPLSR